MPTILVVGANPAWQKTLVFPHFAVGAVNRASLSSAGPGGKGVNFCRAVRCYGQAETHLFQFIGGESGQALTAGLAAEKITATSIKVPAPTRTCTTILTAADDAANSTTELIEPSYTVPPAAVQEFLQAIADTLRTSDIAGVAMVGTLPGGTDLSLYREIAAQTAAAGLPLLFDAADGVAAALDAIAGRGTAYLKINHLELASLTGETDVQAGLQIAAARWPGATLAVTAGAAPGWVFAGGKMHCCPAPRPPRILSTLGCGDTAAAVWFTEILHAVPAPAAFSRALAAAAANCLTQRPGEFSPEEAARILHSSNGYR